jgi:hypothetical protein
MSVRALAIKLTLAERRALTARAAADGDTVVGLVREALYARHRIGEFPCSSLTVPSGWSTRSQAATD